jgi:two-component system, LytTR family, response regulator
MIDSRLAAIVVDDERPARTELARMLTSARDVRCVGEAASIEEALALIQSRQPDVVFLDIVVGNRSGFELLVREERTYDVVFVTAFDEYALRAFDVDAVDYLLKPVSQERFDAAVARLTRRRGTGDVGAMRTFDYDDRVMLRVDGALRMLQISSIVSVTADRDQTRLITTDKAALTVTKTLKEWETRLPAAQFARIHRSTIVNLEFVERIVPLSGFAWLVWVRGMPSAFMMSRRYAARVRRRFA